MKRWFILALLVLIGLLVYYWLKTFDATEVSLPQATSRLYVQDCSPSRGACSVSLDATTIQVELQPSGLPAMVPLTLRVGVSSQVGVQLLRAWFEGRDMDMGRHELTPLNQDDASGAGIMLRGVIPVCSVNPMMVWQLKLLIEVNSIQQLVVFDLATDAMTE